MRKIRIPKGKGRFRQLYIPSPKELASLRELIPMLSQMERERARHFEVSYVAHGFIAGRSPVTCAMRHIGYDVTCSFDLESWFDSITEHQLLCAGVSEEIVKRITVDGALRQGLPTSPVAANLVGVEFDKRLLDHIRRLLPAVVLSYTRYADDIIVSGRTPLDVPLGLHDHDVIGMFSEVIGVAVENAATAMDWNIAEHKTHVQTAKAGRRIIVGVSVGADDIQATRKAKRRLRAAKHQNNARQVAGLSEWIACKVPRIQRGGRRIEGVTPGSGSIPDVQLPSIALDPTNVVDNGVRKISFD